MNMLGKRECKTKMCSLLLSWIENNKPSYHHDVEEEVAQSSWCKKYWKSGKLMGKCGGYNHHRQTRMRNHVATLIAYFPCIWQTQSKWRCLLTQIGLEQGIVFGTPLGWHEREVEGCQEVGGWQMKKPKKEGRVLQRSGKTDGRQLYELMSDEILVLNECDNVAADYLVAST